jgi:uncharacterized surface protein with fasciclin (FAS1) repeats
MTPNTLRIALGILLIGAAPVAIAVLPQQAISDTNSFQAEQLAPMEQSVAAGQSIAEIVSSDDNFEVLTAAIEAAGLTEAFGDSDLEVTVFAPTDDAFAALPDGTLDELLLPENRDQLLQLLGYHVVDGEVRSTDLASGEVATMAGASVVVTVDSDTVTVNDANVVAADINASNGVIHVIDSVLLPI